MTRRAFLGLSLSVLVCAPASARQRKRKGPARRAPEFREGSRAIFRTRDEPRNNAPAFRLGAVGQDFIVFPGGENSGEAYAPYQAALRTGDQAAYDDLVTRGLTTRLGSGALVLVLGDLTELPVCHGLAAPGGYYVCRVQSGPQKGKRVDIPARNLDPAP